ncbi:MAG: hypothetical protein N2Z62_05455 [Rhodobacteraceae bacterium]|nr:hypothetical protein [Paracoccaceae bacterium]
MQNHGLPAVLAAVAAAVLAAVAAALAASGAAAAERLTAGEFEAHVTGRTLYYSAGGGEYGAEQYLPGRRVIWTFLDGECSEGRWYEAEGLICFVYDFDPTPQCWSFWREDGRIAARFENDPAMTELYELRQSDQPLPCPGPEVGV